MSLKHSAPLLLLLWAAPKGKFQALTTTAHLALLKAFNLSELCIRDCI
jgi:hypothetical protein